jgi:hypothetical protein
MVSNTTFFNALLAADGLKDGNDTSALLNLLCRVHENMAPLEVYATFAKDAKEAVRVMEPHYRRMLKSKTEAEVGRLGLAKLAYVYMVAKGQIELGRS